MKIGLYGIYGVYNFGCEAIVRGAYEFVKDIYPNCEVIYFSHSYEYDSKALNDLNIEIVPLENKSNIIKRAIYKGLKFINSNHRNFMFDIKKVINSVDMFVSIGGDIYTIPKILRDKQKYPYYNSLVDFCDRAIKHDKPVIVYGASVGPWGNYKKAVNYNIKALSKYKAILCREEETVDYLRSLGLDKTYFFPDPAFKIKGNYYYDNEKRYIGINLSPLSLYEIYGDFGDKYVVNLANLMDEIYNTFKKELLFIPHVLSVLEKDNDEKFMRKIVSHMKHSNKVIFADTSEGFIGIKKSIINCHLVVCARMHCAINAINENVPTIFLSYSQKSIGLCKYVYGNENYVIDLKDVSFELISKMKELFEDKDEISIFLRKRNKEIDAFYKENIESIKDFLL